MLLRIFNIVRQQAIWLLVVVLVLLAAYVSAGRQFMPAVSRYADFFEEQILEITGLPVHIDSLTGSFQGFNPALQVTGFSLLVSEDSVTAGTPNTSAFNFDHANLVIDIPRSILQRRWVIAEFLVEGLAIDAVQADSGAWQLNGINFSGNGEINLDTLYQSFLQVSLLNLSDVRVDLTTKNQQTFRFSNGTALIQNRNGNHFLHVNANLDNSDEQLMLSFEARGATLARVNGRIHLGIPATDYSELLAETAVGNLTLKQLSGGGNLWVNLQGGRVRSVDSDLAITTSTFADPQTGTESHYTLSGKARLLSGEAPGQFNLIADDLAIAGDGLQWGPFDAHVAREQDDALVVEADYINLDLLARLLDSSGLLDTAGRQQLAAYNPRGELANVSLRVPSASAGEPTRLHANLENVDLSSVNNAPSLWGMDGYVEASYDATTRIARGFAEVESTRFRINIPTVFADTWDYDYVNGRLDFRADLNDGEHIDLVSGVVVAESDIVDGRVQFASALDRYADGRREGNLDLLVGALRADGGRIDPYLPNAPTVAAPLRDTMRWLRDAVLAGEVTNSGVIFRGSTIAGSAPETNTFQSFYQLANTELQFSPDWPVMNELDGLVVTNDNAIDIAVDATSSLGLMATDVVATVRRNAEGENWLEVRGSAHGTTADGLGYLQAAPVGDGLHNAMDNWLATGDLEADIQVRVPLGAADRATTMHVEVQLADNTLQMPDYALDIEALSGAVIYDTAAGLEPSTLTGALFAEPVNIALSSQLDGTTLQAIQVEATGKAGPEPLIAWPMQSGFVRRLLVDMEGSFDYVTRVTVPMAGNGNPRLTIDTPLTGAALKLPQPFAKTADEVLPLHLQIEFGGEDQLITGNLGSAVALHLQLDAGNFQNGTVAFGENWSNIESQINNETSGLAVLGDVDFLEIGEWVEYLTELNAEGTDDAAISDAIAFIDVAVSELSLYDQVLPDVGLHIESDQEAGAWAIALSGDAVQGSVRIPRSSADYLTLDLDYLHLPGSATDAVDEAGTDTPVPAAQASADGVSAGAEADETKTETEEIAEERVDALAGIDPRALPKLHFAADAITIGSRDYGRWQFTLDPDNAGAEFSDLDFDFRGLRVSPTTDPAVPAPHFSWKFDGETHRSYLSAIITAGDIADVLTANGIAPSLESTNARFNSNLDWPGTPAFFSSATLSGALELSIRDGRFQQQAGGAGALKLISIINFDAIMRRLRFSDDLLRRGLAYDSITGSMRLDNGQVTIDDRLVISGPSSLYQITGELNLADQTINGEMYLTLPVSANIPWLGLLTANLPLAVGAYLFDRIFGDQVNNLTSAVYTLQGPWEGLQPQFKQAFGSPGSASSTPAAPAQ
jgi:uncharacterized protein (TIGR02099 family)